MALVLKDRVKEQSTTTGTGTLTLSGAYDGYQAFSVIGNGNVTYYTIYDPATGDWEVGYGTYTLSGTTLSRTFVYDSSNSGNLVNFAAGTKEVFCTYPSEQAIYQETNGNLRLVGGVIGLTQDGTEGTTLPNTSYQAFTTGNYYMQANQQNLSSGAEASSDWVVTADNGNDEENYMDMGMASSGYNYSGFSAFKANTGYLVSTGSDLRLIAGKFGAVTPGGQDIVLIAGSLLDTEERVRVYGDTGNVNIGGGVNASDLGQKLQVVGSASISGAATFGSTVTLNADPSTALQAATKQYVDNAASTGIHIHDPCVSETSAALSAVYTQGGSTFNITDITGNKTLTTSVNHGLSVGDEIWLYNTAGNGLSTNTAYFVYSAPALNQLTVSLTFGGAELTGLTNASGLTYNTRANSGVGAYLEASANEELPISGVIVGDRVLVYQQATGYWNGVYTVTSLGSAGSKWKLTRAIDANHYAPSNTTGLGAGDYFFIQSNSESYVLTDPTGPVIIGYDTITYTLFSSVPAYTVNSPLSLVGTTLSLTTVPANLGGTSFSSYTAGDMLYAAGSTTLNKLAVGSSGQTIISSGGIPTWGALDMAGAGVSGVLAESHGGTNQSSYATGDTLYSSATNTLSKLSGNTSTTRKFLSQTGTGSASAAPLWDTVAASDITSGTLAVARGGTGLGSYAVGDIVYASGTGTLAGLADVATGSVLLSGGTNTAPTYGKVGLATHISGTLGLGNGGTGQTTAQAAINSLAGAVTSGQYLRGNGTNVVMSAIQAADVPTLNQNTTGSAGSVANALTMNNSGTGAASGSTFNGSAAQTISYNTIGASPLAGSSSLTTTGTVTSGTWSASFGAVSGANLTNLTAGNLSGTIPSAVLGNSTAYVGTTAIALNRASANQGLTGITSIAMPGGTSGTITITPAATAGTTALTIPANSGSFVTTGDTGTVTNTMLAGSIANAKLANSSVTINGSAVSLGGSITVTANTGSTLTFNNGGAGGASGSTFNGSGALTVSYNTVGAPSTTGTNASGTWGINISGNAATATGFKNIGNIAVQAVAGSNQSCTTAQFVAWYSSTYGFLSYTYTVAKCTWDYAGNNEISDTSIGSCEMAGCVIETFADGTYYTLRITRPTTGTGGSQQLVYNNQGAGYSPGWWNVLNTSNYTSYAPSLTGSGASGTWSINVTGSAGSASTATNASYAYNYTQGFNSNWNTDFQNAPAGSTILRGDTSTGSSTGGPGGTWWFQQNMRHTNNSNYWGVQVAWGWEDNANILRTRNVTGGSFGSWVTYLNSSNYTSYSPSLTGSGASGTWSINVTGSAGSTTNFMSTSHAGTYWLVNNWDGTYWYITSNHGAGVRVARADSAGSASSASYATYLSGAPAYTNGSDGWWRSSGQAGWYNSDYAVGIYATEAGNVRTYNGANFIAAGTVTANSDERLKENWRPVKEDFVSKLAEVKSGVYDRVDLEHHKTQAGVSAQAWQKLLPETVLEDSEGILSVAYGNAALVAAIELAKEVVKLREELEALKSAK